MLYEVITEILANEAASQDDNPENDEQFYADRILEMRESGMGWGEIVHALNADPDSNLDIHPSVLGLGHSKKSSKAVHLSRNNFV